MAIRIFPRSISLAAQLLIAFVGLVVATTSALTVAAYRSSLDNLEREALRDVGVMARTLEHTLTELLAFRNQRAEGFLLSVEAICAEPAGPRGFGWSEDCVNTMMDEFRLTERASGVQLEFRGRVVDTSGTRVAPGAPAADALALVVARADGGSDFLIRATHRDTVLKLQFDSRDMLRFFDDAPGGQRTREVFLTDNRGRFLTPPRYATTTGTPPGAGFEPLDLCRALEGERIAIDYRGVLTVHGYQPVEALGGGCIDAHVSYDEALEPLQALLIDLLERGALFTVLGALLSLIAAHRIASPVRRLVMAARNLQGGHFDQRIIAGGPSEVHALGRALAAMAEDLAKLVTREQATRRDAEAANRSKDHFLATLSHELRTPLNAIVGWTRLLRDGRLDEVGRRRAVEAIERGADAQRQLIEDLLDISRIVSGQLRMVRHTVSLPDVIEASVEALRPRAGDKGVRIDTDIERDGLCVLGDPQRLQQIVWNLSWNGIKFTPPDGSILVRLRRVAGAAELSVIDSGIGISPELLPHVFDWYRQGSPSSGDREAGLGVGLSLVQQLVELHGGSIRAESGGPGHGSTFTVTLPLHLDDRVAIPVSAPGAGAARGTQLLVQRRVLLVDDDAETREVVRTLLEEAGAAVATAATADEARQYVSRQSPDVLISDIAMPVEDGYQLVESLRASGIRTPAVALTGYARREDAERAHAAGFQVHMPKPVDPARLIHVVAALLSGNAAN